MWWSSWPFSQLMQMPWLKKNPASLNCHLSAHWILITMSQSFLLCGVFLQQIRCKQELFSLTKLSMLYDIYFLQSFAAEEWATFCWVWVRLDCEQWIHCHPSSPALGKPNCLTIPHWLWHDIGKHSSTGNGFEIISPMILKTHSRNLMNCLNFEVISIGSVGNLRNLN